MQSIIKCKNDKLLYRVVELASRLRCVLICDAETEKSAAVMAVNVGSLQDPKSHEGLAHFLEHMLFMGSASFPDVAGYTNFISQAGGSTNAFTCDTQTCYFFNIPNAEFGAALSMFSEFFICPLLRPDNVDKELQAVNSEHEKNLLRDNWRQAQVFKALADPASPYCKSFSTGSLATLRKPDVHQQVRDFYHATYSANLMSLVLYANCPLDELERFAREKFSAVADKAVEQASFAAQAFFTPAQMGRLVRVKTVNKERRLQLAFLLPSLQKDFRRKPLDLVNHLLGHEGEGSILSQLIAEKLAYALSAGAEHVADAHTFATLTLKLTARGFEQFERVLLLVGQYVRNLAGVVPQWVFEEYKLLRQIAFDFESKKDEVSRAMDVALSARDFPVEFALSHDYYLEEYAPEAYARVLDALRLDNALVLLCCDEFGELPLREEVYGTAYGVEPLAAELLGRFAQPGLDVRERLRLPPPNPFVPQRFALKPGAELPRPQRILVPARAERGELFFHQSVAFALPKTQITYQFNTRRERDAADPRAELCARIWRALLAERLKEYTYLAEAAQLHFSLETNARGFAVKLAGFDDSAARFFRELGARIRAFAALAAEPAALREDFENKSAQLRQELTKKLNGDLFRYALAAREWVLQTGGHAVPALLAELDELRFEDYLAYHARAVERFSFDALISGNMLPEEALRLHEEFFEALGAERARPLEPLDAAQRRVPALQAGRTFVLQGASPLAEDTNNCALIVLQGAQEESRRALLQLAANLTSAQFFDELRTQQQLGYVVIARECVLGGVLHFFFLVQSGVVGSHEIARRVYAHLDATRARVRALPAEEFEQARRGLLAELSQPFFNLAEQHEHFYEEIRKRSYNFDWRERAAELLRGLDQAAFADFFDRFFFAERKAVEVHFSAARDAAANALLGEERARAEPALCFLPDARALQGLLPLYPDAYAKLAG